MQRPRQPNCSDGEPAASRCAARSVPQHRRPRLAPKPSSRLPTRSRSRPRPKPSPPPAGLRNPRRPVPPKRLPPHPSANQRPNLPVDTRSDRAPEHSTGRGSEQCPRGRRHRGDRTSAGKLTVSEPKPSAAPLDARELQGGAAQVPATAPSPLHAPVNPLQGSTPDVQASATRSDAVQPAAAPAQIGPDTKVDLPPRWWRLDLGRARAAAPARLHDRHVPPPDRWWFSLLHSPESLACADRGRGGGGRWRRPGAR
jgi:hypothetical protein